MDCGITVDPLYTQNITVTTINVVQVALLSVIFPLSFVGVILNVVFICRKRTNFLVRRIVYVTVATTLQLGGYWVWSITAFMPEKSLYNYCVNSELVYLNVVTPPAMFLLTVLVCSISISLYVQLCDCACCCCCSRHSRRNLTNRQLVCLEVFYVITVFGFSLILGIVFAILTFVNGSIGNVHVPGAYYVDVFLFFPLPVLLSFIGNIVLLVWFCCRRRQIARAAAIAKELGVFFLLSLVTMFVWTSAYISAEVFFYSSSLAMSAMVFYALTSLFPLVVFVYMCYSFRAARRHVRFANADYVENNIQTAGLPTAPDSTRISLPTDTAAHAPNFLSPSTAEPSEVTSLLH